MITWKKYILNMKLYPGLLLKLDQRHNNEILLVGDVNDNLGCCECCKVYKESITHYSEDLVDVINSKRKES